MKRAIIITAAALVVWNVARADVYSGVAALVTFDSNYSSPRLLDAGANHNDAYYITGGAATSSLGGVVGQALSLTNTSGQRVFIPDSASLDLSAAGTVSVWVKYRTVNTGAANAPRLVSWGAGNYSWIGQNAGPFKCLLFDGTANRTVSGSSNPVANQWYMVTMAWTGGSQMSCYVNGVLVGSVALTGSPSPGAGNRTVVMNDSNPPLLANFVDGAVDDLRLYSTRLSASDVAQLYYQQRLFHIF